MKINVVEADISRMGGRQSSILQFANYFKKLGYEIQFISSFGLQMPECPTKKAVLEYHNLDTLTFEDFDWDFRLYKRRNNWPKNCDLYFIASPAWTNISKITNIPNITWKIVDWIQCTAPETVLEFWTNSEIIKSKISNLEKPIYTVRPPYSYDCFRKKARMERDIDIIDIARVNTKEAKGIFKFAEIVKKFNLKAILVVLIHDNSDLNFMKGLEIPFVYNLPKKKVAEYLGRSKIFFHPSVDESCSISIYEALNAGCFPIIYDVGAAAEQLGEKVFWGTADELIQEGLDFDGDREVFINQGKKFDVENIGETIKQRLEKIENAVN